MALKATVTADQRADRAKRQIRVLRAKINAKIKERSALQRELRGVQRKRDKAVAKLISIAEERAKYEVECYEAMWRRWGEAHDTFPLKELTSMTVCVRCFPASVTGLTRCPNWGANRTIGVALDALNGAHKCACGILGRHASRLGLNGAAIEIAGEHCRRMFRDNPEDWATDPKDGTWPNCLWGRRKSLPAEIRRTIERGATVLKQLEHKLSNRPPGATADSIEKAHDGPVTPDSFRYKGKPFRGIARGPFHALEAAWAGDAHCLDTRDLPAALGDGEELLADFAVQSIRGELNDFFRRYKIEFHAVVRDGGRYLAIHDGPPRAAAARKKPRKKASKGRKTR